MLASDIKTESTITSERKDYVGSSFDNYWWNALRSPFGAECLKKKNNGHQTLELLKTCKQEIEILKKWPEVEETEP